MGYWYVVGKLVLQLRLAKKDNDDGKKRALTSIKEAKREAEQQDARQSCQI